MAAGAETLRRTPLYDRHVAAQARLVPFAGWEMLQLSSEMGNTASAASSSSVIPTALPPAGTPRRAQVDERR